MTAKTPHASIIHDDHNLARFRRGDMEAIMTLAKSVEHLQLYEAYLLANDREAQLEAETKELSDRDGDILTHAVRESEDREDAASDHRYEILKRIIDAPALSPAALYVQGQVLIDVMERDGTLKDDCASGQLARVLIAGLARFAVMERIPCAGGDSALEAVERLHEDAYQNWNAEAALLPESANLEESDHGYSAQAVAMLDAAALIPAAGPRGLGVKVRLLASPHYGGTSPSLRALEKSLQADMKRLAAGAGGAVDERERSMRICRGSVRRTS